MADETETGIKEIVASLAETRLQNNINAWASSTRLVLDANATVASDFGIDYWSKWRAGFHTGQLHTPRTKAEKQFLRETDALQNGLDEGSKPLSGFQINTCRGISRAPSAFFSQLPRPWDKKDNSGQQITSSNPSSSLGHQACSHSRSAPGIRFIWFFIISNLFTLEINRIGVSTVNSGRVG